MGFASAYISRHALYNQFLFPEVFPDMVVVIPCMNEPAITRTLDSLNSCIHPNGNVEVIIVVNASESAKEEVLKRNKKTITEIEQWQKDSSPFFQCSYIEKNDLPRKHAGVGLARKIGMDEAICHFDMAENARGIIISMDADTTVAENYFIEIEKTYREKPDLIGTHIYFEHPINSEGISNENASAIVKYELYLRYFVFALRLAGFPFAFHTVGSCFTVRADIYCSQGGMNKRQAGEDFYFLHKIYPVGSVCELNTTTIFPSARESDRVPFGTGPEVVKIINDFKGEYRIYDPHLFSIVGKFISICRGFYNLSAEQILSGLKDVPPEVVNYFGAEQLVEGLMEINQNVSSEGAFVKRFFRWFDAFRIIKFLNSTSEELIPRIPVEKAAATLLDEMGISCEEKAELLLDVYRELEKNNAYKVGV